MVTVENAWQAPAPSWSETLKKAGTTLLKVALSLSIIAYLVWDAACTQNANGENIFQQLVHQPKHWGMLAMAWVFCFMAVMITLIRWWYLVCALELPFSLRDALRIGFLGYLFNLAPLGIVGGDLLKAVMLARKYPERRPQAVATVFLDRIIGLYMLFIVATVAILVTGFHQLPVPEIQLICKATFILTSLGAVGIAGLLIPGITEGRVTHALGRIPKIGHILESLIDAVRMYRRKPHVLVIAAAMSVFVHSFFAIGVYLIARGLPGDDLSLASHFVVAPVSATTGVLPLPLGPFEFVLEFLYTHVPAGVMIPKGQGLVVALAYRLICLLIAMVGVGYYLSSRQEVAELMHEVEQEPQPVL